MNSYKITYVVDEGQTEETYITERTEAAARKAFKKLSGGREITDVELHDTEAPATKAQERETLEKIKAMVAELGPQSYLATALEGTFEIAEQNIEYDFGDSLKGRLESTQEREADPVKELAEAKAGIARLNKALEATQEEAAALKKRQLSEELRRDLWMLMTDEAAASRARMAEAADKMAVGADNPGCVLFKDAVALYRAEKARAEAMEQRADELDAMEPETK